MKKLLLTFFIILMITGCNAKDNSKGISMSNEELNRRSILAGSWYPSNPAELESEVDGYINSAELEFNGKRILGLISPHAGYLYSGPVMGYTFKALKQQAENFPIKTIIILAFSHRGDGDGRVSVWSKGAWETPLGNIPVNEEIGLELIESNPMIGLVPQTHTNEHSLEILLPFIQDAMGKNDFDIVPISFSSMTLNEVDNLIASLAEIIHDRDDIIIIASTDMSHYHTQSKAISMDRDAIEYITDGDINSLLDGLAKRKVELCGWGPVVTMMKLSDMFNADQIELLHYANSGDIPEGDTSRVVGYCSIAFCMDDKFERFENKFHTEKSSENMSEDYTLTREQKLYLLKLARESIEEKVKSSRTLEIEEPDDKKLREKAAVFVTLNRDGMLRGCIGQMFAQGPLYLAVRDMAISAAMNDHRFRPVSQSELDKIDIEISVMSPLKKAESYKDIRLGVDGVYIVGHYNGGTRTGVFLPVVATDTGWNLDEFLGELCSQKAGLPREYYKNPDAEIYTFTVLKFSEAELLTGK